MKALYTILAMTALLAAGGAMYLAGGEPVSLDPAFEHALETEYGIAAGSFSPKQAEGITELDVSGYGITDLSGIEHFHSLVSLDASDNLLTDAEEVGELEKLETVDLSSNGLETVRFRSSMLHTINLEANRLTDLAFAGGLPELRELNVRDNDIHDLSPVAELHSLTHLNVRGNRIADLAPLQNLPNLTDLNLRNNEIESYEPLNGLLSLTERLYITGNRSNDYTAVEPLAASIQDIDFEAAWAPPAVSVESGPLVPGTAIELTTDVENAWIFYTLDGSEPTAASARYTEPIVINEESAGTGILSNIQTSITQEAFALQPEQVRDAVVLRAKVYFRRQFSPAVTETYFLTDRPFGSADLPVLSLSIDERDLFSEESGIYVPGFYYSQTGYSSEGNYFQRGSGWERKASIEWFEGAGERRFQQDIGVRIHGGYSRSLPQKSLRLYARSDFGAAHLSHPFFGEGKQEKFDRLILRNSGNDHNSTFFRDGLMHRLVEDGPVETMAHRPAVVLVNGEYWGIHNIRDSFSDSWIEERHHVSEGEAVIIETDPLAPSGYSVDEGTEADLQPFLDLLAYAESHDLNDPGHLSFVEAQMDIDNYLHYLAYQVYFGNLDSFGNNTAMWKKRSDTSEGAPYGHDGRWRWLLYDTDQGFGENRNIADPVRHNTLQWAMADEPGNRLTRALLANPDIAGRFIEIMEGLLQNGFETERVTALIDEMAADIAPEMPRHIERWQAPRSFDVWQQEVERLRVFARERPAAIRSHLDQVFSEER